MRLDRTAIRRIAYAAVLAEVRRVRGPGAPGLPPGDWANTTAIGDEGLGLDSLEQLGALGALAEMFELDDAALGPAQPTQVGDWYDWIERAAPERIAVSTSGSTGTPRPCVHPIADLLDEAAFLADQLRDRRRVVAMVPAHHLYGIIWTALLPAALAVPIVTRTLGAALDLQPGDLVVAVPEQWQAIARMNRRLPADLCGVSSAGRLEAALGEDLLAASVARIIDVYGSSETGAIALRDLPATSYALLPRWQLVGEDGDWQLADRTGRIVPLPDHVERTGPRALRPIGRRDGAVQVGGHNVWPEHVARTLRATPGVADAAVRLAGNGRLKAFVVPSGTLDPAALSAALEQTAADRLSDPERPKSIRFGTALPRNEMGKLCDWT